jgi:hypothetical protein
MKKVIFTIIILIVFVPCIYIAVTYYISNKVINEMADINWENTSLQTKQDDMSAPDNSELPVEKEEKQIKSVIKSEELGNESVSVPASVQSSSDKDTKLVNDIKEKTGGQDKLQAPNIIKKNVAGSTTVKKEETVNSTSTEDKIKRINKENISDVQKKITFSDRMKIANMILNKLKPSDIDRLKNMMEGGITDEKKEEVRKLIYERFTEEEIQEIKKLFYKYF